MKRRNGKVARAAEPKPEAPAEAQPQTLPPVEAVVELAKALLSEAEAGRIRGLAATIVRPDATTHSATAVQPNDVVMTQILNSGIATLFCAHNKAIITPAS